MLPRLLYLTCHGLGTPGAHVRGESCRFWLPEAVFARTLEVAANFEAKSGIEITFTFDDGNTTDVSVALPLLQQSGRKGYFFVCAGRIGMPGYLDAASLRRIADAGMTIGCHGYAHVDWCRASDTELAHELIDGRNAIADVTGRPVEVASAPFGALDKRVVRAAAGAGYVGLFASSGGFASAARGLIPRNTLKDGFDPDLDLPQMVRHRNRLWAGIYDNARRLKYGFY